MFYNIDHTAATSSYRRFKLRFLLALKNEKINVFGARLSLFASTFISMSKIEIFYFIDTEKIFFRTKTKGAFTQSVLRSVSVTRKNCQKSIKVAQ